MAVLRNLGDELVAGGRIKSEKITPTSYEILTCLSEFLEYRFPAKNT
jgi:hypothetical protein